MNEQRVWVVVGGRSAPNSRLSLAISALIRYFETSVRRFTRNLIFEWLT